MKMTRTNLFGAAVKGLVVLPLAASLAGCTRDHEFQPVDMWNHSRLKPYEPSASQSDLRAGTTARVMPAGSIARGQLQENDALYTGMANGRLVTAFPIPVNEATLKRGQERYTIYCAPCHGGLGDGKGLMVTRGFAKPPDYLEPRVLNAPIGHYYDAITNGYGAMYSYAARVPVKDRWAIAAYIRLLQRTRAQGKSSGPTIRGGGVYEHLTPVKGAAHEESHAGGHETGHDAPKGETTVPGSVPHSFNPSDSSHGVGSGTGAGQSETGH